MAKDWNRARLIFVCSGNICRSPMAHVLCEQMFAQRELKPMVISMGTLNIIGRPAASNAIAALEEVGYDLSRHRSQGLSAALMNAADVSFGMEQKHLDRMRKCGPGAFKTSRLLSRWAPTKIPGIADPVGGPIEDFRASRDLITACLERWFSEYVDR